MSLLPFSQAIALPPTPNTAAHLVQPSIYDQHVSTSHEERREQWWHLNTASLIRLRQLLIQLYKNNIGLLLIAASQLFMTFMNISVKFLNDVDNPVPTLELVFVRMFITYCCSVSYMIVRKIPHAVLGPPEIRSLLIFRGVSGFFGLFGIYYSLKYLSLSDAVVLTFLSPTTTAVAGFLFLHETLSRREVFAGFFSLMGVVLIARPQSLFGTNASQEIPDTAPAAGGTDDAVTSSQRLIAVGVAMIGVTGATGAYISLRAIGKRAHIMHSLTFFSSYSVVVSTILMLALRIKPVIPSQWSWCWILASVGICGFIAQILLVMGLQRETASRGALALYVQIIYTTVLERLIFKVIPSYLSVFGTSIIIGSAIYIVVTKSTESGAYKLIPQTAEDIESHELADTPETLGVVDQGHATAGIKLPSLRDDVLLDNLK